MGEGSVWFRAAIGRRKNAEARWLLPMICRRGGIDKHDIGAIRIMDTTTEFEISERAAESFAAMIRRPDKEDNIRIELLAEAPQPQAAPEPRSHAPRPKGGESDAGARHNDKPRDERGPKHHGKARGESHSRFDKDSGHQKKRHQDRPAYAGQPAGGPAAKPGFGKKKKKPKKDRRG
jgi:ATP-dependent RNA helicase DeaD